MNKYFLTVFQVNVNVTHTFSQIHGQGVDKEPQNLIGFNNNTGDISILGPVDREKYDIFKVRGK